MTRSYSSLLLWLGLTIGASLMLFHTSDRVNALDHQLHALNTQIESEQQSIHILKAEWVYLANPARIEAEAQRHLGLQATAPRHIVAQRDISALLPLHNGIDTAPAVQTAENDIPGPVHPAPTETRTGLQHMAANTHINDRMIMQHTAKAEASTDRIGALIGSMGLRP